MRQGPETESPIYKYFPFDSSIQSRAARSPLFIKMDPSRIYYALGDLEKRNFIIGPGVFRVKPFLGKRVIVKMLNFPVKPTAVLLLLICGMIPIGLAGCSPGGGLPGGQAAPAEPAASVDPRLVEANTAFAFDLFQALHAEGPARNIFISPASVSLALAMTYNGAAAETAAAMAKTLHLQELDREEMNSAFADLRTILQNPDPKVELALANSLWARQGQDFYNDFLQRNRDYFDARVEALDFDQPQAAETINRWVEEKTKGKIKDLIEPPIDPLTVLFLINAISLKAQWSESFDPDRTREIPFHLPEGSSIEHPVMFREGEFQYLPGDGFQAIFLPYGKNGRVGLYLFLPDPDRDLEDFYQQLDRSRWASWRGSFSPTKGTVGLPRFQFEYETTLNDGLKSLGMAIAFDSAAADFSAMRAVPPNLYIAEVRHKTFIEVNEAGTEAAGATSVEIREESASLDQFSLIADRPFFFSIVDQKTGVILFMGAVSNPQP